MDSGPDRVGLSMGMYRVAADRVEPWGHLRWQGQNAKDSEGHSGARVQCLGSLRIDQTGR